MLAADTDFQILAALAPEFYRELHEISHPALIDDDEGVA